MVLLRTIIAISLSVFCLEAAAEKYTRAFLSHGKAMQGMQACVALAEREGWNMSVVIIDRGEDIVASARMDGALPASYKGALLKAETALSWGIPTGKVNEIMDKYPVFKQFPGILGIDGGMPIFSGKTLVGGIGVAGSSMDKDALCAQAAIDATQ